MREFFSFGDKHSQLQIVHLPLMEKKDVFEELELDAKNRGGIFISKKKKVGSMQFGEQNIRMLSFLLLSTR